MKGQATRVSHLMPTAVYRSPRGLVCRLVPGWDMQMPWVLLEYLRPDGTWPRAAASGWANGFTLSMANLHLLERIQ